MFFTLSALILLKSKFSNFLQLKNIEYMLVALKVSKLGMLIVVIELQSKNILSILITLEVSPFKSNDCKDLQLLNIDSILISKSLL